MNVRVDQAGGDAGAVQVDLVLGGVPSAEAGDAAADDGDVGFFDFAGEDVQHPRVAQEQVGRCVATRGG